MKVETTSQYRREYKLAKKRGLPMHELDDAVEILKSGRPLPPKYLDHPLQGKFKGTHECHIRGNWLLVYSIDDQKVTLLLMRTGTHSDIFGNSKYKEER